MSRLPTLVAPTAALECAHGKPIRQCGKCSKEGEQYELDREIEKAAGNLTPGQWLERASLFAEKATRLRLSLGGRHPMARAAQRASREARLIARALLEARRTREADAPAVPQSPIITPKGAQNGKQRS